MRLRVAEVVSVGAKTRKFTLKAIADNSLPHFTAGAHIELEVPLPSGQGAVRQYSISNFCQAGDVPDRYEVGIQRDDAGRGGSVWLHANLGVGSEVEIRGPRNNFQLDSGQEKAVLIAGGIGITPILSMARACESTERPYDLHFFCRDAVEAPFVAEIQALTGGAVKIHAGLGPQEVSDLLGDMFERENRATHFYTCGPTGLLDSVIERGLAAGFPEAQIHFERFGAAQKADDKPFTAVLSSGRRIDVGAGETLLEALAREGIGVPSNCNAGTCGTCLLMVLEGEIDHRDTVLSEAEKAEDTMMCPCVSRAMGDEIVIDV